jgi:outer membrane receptor protein involved in Fe transport
MKCGLAQPSCRGNTTGDQLPEVTVTASKRLSTVQETAALVHLPAYGLVNLRFGAFGDNWTASLFANNLLNKEALLDPQPQINLQTAAFARYIVNQPRTVGVDLTYEFH